LDRRVTADLAATDGSGALLRGLLDFSGADCGAL